MKFDYIGISERKLKKIDGLLLKEERIVVPETMRQETFNVLHSSHQGVVRTEQLTKGSTFLV